MYWRSEPYCVSYVNAHCLNLAARDEAYRALLNSFDLVYSDGIGAVWAGRLLHGKRLHKVTGRDWIGPLCSLAEAQGLSLYILAGKPGVAQRSQQELMRRWPALRILGASDGYFAEKTEMQVLAEIVAAQPHLLLVGMGAPRQEQWIAHHRKNLGVKVCWAVGALFDYVVGLETPVPPWMQNLSLEWLWRLWQDPSGKWRRYLLGIPAFLVRIFWEMLRRR